MTFDPEHPLDGLRRSDKYQLGGGEGLLFAPAHPRWLERPGFWDGIQLFQHVIRPAFTIAIVRGDGRELRLDQTARSWTPAELDSTYIAEDLAVTKERNRMAREIHDGLGHYLTVVNVQLEAARALVHSDPARAEAALGKAQKMAQEGLADVRRSVTALRESPVAERSVTDALAELVAASNAAGVATTLHVVHEPRPVPPKAALTLYRASQEALTNIRKHAAATEATMTLAFEPDRVDLTVADNGAGSDRPGAGFGLLGIRERVQLLNGTFDVRTAVGQGFVLALSVPAPAGEGAIAT